MGKTELLKNALELEHKVALEEYKLSLTFILGLLSGVAFTTYFSIPTWYYYFAGACFVSFVLWKEFAVPKRDELKKIAAMVKALG